MLIAPKNTMNLTKMFPNWNIYADALCESLNTETFGNSYPEYEALNRGTNNCDVIIVEELLKSGYDPQEGLEAFTTACLNGPRYLPDMAKYLVTHSNPPTSILQCCIDKFVEYGAKITQKMVDHLFTVQQFGDLESEQTNVSARGIMLDVYINHNIDISSHGDWTKIQGMYWEDIPIDVEYTKQCQMYLKDSSEYLRKL